MWPLLAQTCRDFAEDECPRLAAALAYYLFFALPALLVAVVFVGGLLVDRAAVADRLRSHFEETIGPSGAEQLTLILQNASRPQRSWSGWVVGGVMLLMGATGALQELQTAMNRAWRVEPDPDRGMIRWMLLKRLLSLGLILGIAALLLVSLIVSWGLAAFGQWLDIHGAAWYSARLMGWLHTLLSVSIYVVLFATLLRFLPDVELAWSDVWSGAIVTALLFWAGQAVIARYLAWSHPTSAYGAAGSLAAVLLWMYYSALIFFWGAEFTQANVRRRGILITPKPGARVCSMSRLQPRRFDPAGPANSK